MKLIVAAKVSLLFAFIICCKVDAKTNDLESVTSTYADIALAVYQDSLNEAIVLRKEIRKLVSKPSEEQLALTRRAWVKARVPYSQSEVFRFGNPIVDEWEGNVNAWPLDEGLIDYVLETSPSSSNSFSSANIIANKEIYDGEAFINALKIDGGLLNVLHSIGDIETNVATGYHAIEFLLWGQDSNGTEAGAGNRQYTDFDRKKCTNGNCFRRSAYLKAAADLLVKELTWMTKQWEQPTDKKFSYINGNDIDVFDIGTARKFLLKLSNEEALAVMITGMGSLTYGELAGERTKLALILNDPEEEQDCFSDNTHNSHFYNLQGVRNVFFGEYQRVDGSVVSGNSISKLLKSVDKKTQLQLVRAFDHSLAQANNIVNLAENQNTHFDQLIAADNKDGARELNRFIESLLQLTVFFTRMTESLGLEEVVFEGSDAFVEADGKEFFR